MTDKYFKSLNYSLANEDTWPEVRLLRKWGPKKILSVAGSGGRSLPLLAGVPSELHVIDLSEQQLWLGSLREETIRKCSHEDFLLFWGYPPFDGIVYNRRRKEIFKGLDLTSSARQYFNQLFDSVAWNTILYEGKWEKTFRKFSFVTRVVMGTKLLMESLSCLTTQEQQVFEKEKFPRARWDLVFKILGNATVFNALLYKGHFVKKNVPESHFEYYKAAFGRIFGQTLLHSNFFAQLCFFGKIVTKEAIPVEGDKYVFESMKKWLISHRTKSYMGNILELIPAEDALSEIDFLSFSDVPSYFEGDTERNYLQIIRPKMSIGGIVLIRNYLRLPESPDLTGFDDVTAEVAPEFYDEKVQMYMIRAYRKKN
jgi:S-adenosylmethionine-diacylglycerol 3-amino-3-carboxypropyl transferase